MARSNSQQISEIPAGAFVELQVLEEGTGDTSGKSLAEAILEIGTIDGLSADLSTNPQYMVGFGETKT